MMTIDTLDFVLDSNGRAAKEMWYHNRDHSIAVIIKAGPRGWTTYYSENAYNINFHDYNKNDDTTEANFKTTYRVAFNKVGPLICVMNNEDFEGLRKDDEGSNHIEGLTRIHLSATYGCNPPASKFHIREDYCDKYKNIITIEATPTSYEVLFNGKDYIIPLFHDTKTIKNGTKVNFEEAYKAAVEEFGDLEEIVINEKDVTE